MYTLEQLETGLSRATEAGDQNAINELSSAISSMQSPSSAPTYTLEQLQAGLARATEARDQNAINELSSAISSMQSPSSAPTYTLEQLQAGLARATEARDQNAINELSAAISSMQPPEPTPEDQSFLREVADVPLKLGQGAVMGVRMIADSFGASNEFSDVLRDTEDYLADLMSAQSKEDSREIARIMDEAKDKGIADQLWAGVKALSIAPIDVITNALGTSAPIIIAGLVSGPAGLAAAGTMGLGVVKGAVYESVTEGLTEAGGYTPEAIERLALEAQEYGGENTDMILAGGALGVLASRGIEPLLAKGIQNKIQNKVTGEAIKQGTLKTIAKKAGEAGVLEAVPEFLQGSQEQLSRNIAQQRVGLDTPTMRGVVSQGTLEGLAGLGLGTAIGGISAIPSRPAVEQEEGTQTSGFVTPENLELDAEITNDEKDVAVEKLEILEKNINPINIKEEVRRNRLALKQLQDRGLDLADPKTEREVRDEYENIRSLIDLAETEETVTGELFDLLGVNAKAPVRDDFIGKPIRESIEELSQYANRLGKATTLRKRIKDFTSSYDTLFPVEEVAEETTGDEFGEPTVVGQAKKAADNAAKKAADNAAKKAAEQAAEQAAERDAVGTGVEEAAVGTEEVDDISTFEEINKAEKERIAEEAELRKANIKKADDDDAKEAEKISLSDDANKEIKEFTLPLVNYKGKKKSESDKIVINYIKRFGNNFNQAFDDVAYNIAFETKKTKLSKTTDAVDIYNARKQLIKEYRNDGKNFEGLTEARQDRLISDRVSENKEGVYTGTGSEGNIENAKKVRDWAENNFPAEDFQKLKDLIESEKIKLEDQEEYNNRTSANKTEAQQDQARKDAADRIADADDATTEDEIKRASQESDSMGATPTDEALTDLDEQLETAEEAAAKKAAEEAAEQAQEAKDKLDEQKKKREAEERSEATKVLKKKGIEKPTEKQIKEQVRNTKQEQEVARTEEIKKLVQKYLEEAKKVGNNLSAEDINQTIVKNLTKNTNIFQAELENAVVDQIIRNKIIETVFGSKSLPFDARVDFEKNISDIVKEELRAGNLSGALQALSKTLINRDLARFARRFSEVITTTKVKIVDNLTDENGNKLAGRFDPRTNTVEIDSDGGMNAHTILHEVTHALVSAEVAKGDKSPAVKRLKKLYDIAKETISDVYGATNLDEFISESQSNIQFRKTLNRIKEDGSKFTVLQRVLNELGNIVGRILGKESKPTTDILSEIDVLVDSILSPSPEYRDATPLNAVKFADNAANAIKGNLSQDGIVKGIKDFLKGNKVRKLNKFVPAILNAITFAKLARSVGFGNLGFSQFKLINRMNGEVQLADKNATAKTKELEKIYKEFPKVKKVLDAIIYDMDYGATVYNVNPFAAKSKYKDKTDKSGNKLEEVWDEQEKQLKTLNTAEKAKAEESYNLQKNEYRKQFIALIKQILNLIDGQDLDAKAKENLKRTIVGKILNIKIEEEVKKQRSEAIKVLKKKGIKKPTEEQIEEQVNKNNPNPVESMLKKLDDIEYFPLRRTGEYSLSYTITAAGEEVNNMTMGKNFELFTSITDRDAAYEALIKAEFAEDVKRYNTPKETQEGYANIKDVEPIIKIIEDNIKDTNTKNNIIEQIVNVLASASPEKSLAQAFLNRENIPGFEPDTLKAFQYKPFEIAYNRVKLKYSRELLALDKIIKERYEKIREAKVPRLLGVEITDVDAVYESLVARSKYARQGANNKKLESYIRNINQGAFLYTIGFNPSSALVQLGQIPVFALSWFGAKYGMGKSVKAFSKAARIVISSNMNMASFYDIDETGKFSVKEDLDISAEKRKELEEVLPAVQNLYRRGGLQIDFDKEQKSIEELSPSKDKNPLDRATANSAIMFNYSERFNRQTMTIAAYLMSLDAGTKNNQGKKATKTQIEEALEESFLESSLANTGGQLEVAAPALKQGIGRIAGMFKGYGLSMYTLMFIDAYKAITNAYPKTAQGRKERDIAFKRFVGVNLSSLLLLGVMGTPIYGLLEMILDSLFFWDDDDETKDIVRKSLPDVLSRGLIEGVTGMSVTDRLRLNNLVIQENRFAKTDESVEEMIGRYAGGPALSTALRAKRGYDFFMEGEVRRGLENFVPAGIANLSKAQRDFSEGAVKTTKGAIIQEDYGLLDMAYKVVGFQSTELESIQNINRYKKRIDTEINSQKSKIISKFNDAVFKGDSDKFSEALADILEFNNEHPFQAITVDSMQKSNKSYIKRILEQEQGLTVTTNIARIRSQEFNKEKPLF